MSLKYINSNGNELIIAGNGKDGKNGKDNNDKIPVGAGMDYFGATPPENYMFADGSAISRTEYAELFAILGTTYGAGDGSTTFNLPDKRSRVSVMMNSSDSNFDTLGKKIGSASTTLVAANLPALSGTLGIHGVANGSLFHSVSGVFSSSTKITEKYGTLNYSSGSSYSYGPITYSNGGKSTAFSNIQQTFVCNYIIKVKNSEISTEGIVLNVLEGEY